MTVLFSFTNGTFGIARDSKTAIWQDLDVTRGFTAFLHYNDGTGSYYEAGWGTTNWTNEPITVYKDDFGLNNRYEDTPVFLQFMGQNYRDDIHEPKRQEVIADFARYSDFYRDQFVEREQVLSYAFWYYVYNNDGVDRDELMEFMKLEQNEKLRALSMDGEYLESVAMVYDKLRFFNTNKRHSMWFIFWHDLWMNNMFMPPFVQNEDFLSPFKASSICYQFVEDKEDLVKQLEEKGICAKPSSIRKGWVNSTLIDLLYGKMDDLHVMNPEEEDENNAAAVQEQEEEHIQIEKMRRCATVRLCADVDIVEEYGRACTMMTTMCTHDQ